MSATPRVAAVVPVHDGRALLPRTLPALLRAGRDVLDEVVVVDDGSTDRSGELAETLGADLALAPVTVVRSGETPAGPAAARNLGVEHTRADLVLFVDADVEVHADAVAGLVAALSDDPTLTAVYGSYDDRPAHDGFASRYMNLRHHQGHRQPRDDAPTFWAGLGAVRRDAFTAVGGFDAERYRVPSIEDIELGRRLRAAGGRIARRPDLQGTHLKRWTLAEVVHTDVHRRARPWARLMREHPGAFDDLNVGRIEQLRAGLAWLFVLATVALLLGQLPVVPWLGLCGAVLLAHARFAALLSRVGGPAFALAALGFHQVHYLYATWAWAAGRRDG